MRLTDDHTIVVVPVKFPQGVWLEIYVGSGSPSGREVSCGVLYLGPTTGRDVLLLLGEAEDVRVGNLSVRRDFGLCFDILRRGDGAPENEGILGGNVLESRDVEAEILSDDFERGVNEPVGKHECGPGGIEVTVGEQE